jgi:Wax ester synthase-like Acyl-CoA acyltransferase domain
VARHCRPAGPDQLHRLIARIMTRRMDRTRPQWEYCMVDGVSGTALYEVIIDHDPVTSE